MSDFNFLVGGSSCSLSNMGGSESKIEIHQNINCLGFFMLLPYFFLSLKNVMDIPFVSSEIFFLSSLIILMAKKQITIIKNKIDWEGINTTVVLHQIKCDQIQVYHIVCEPRHASWSNFTIYCCVMNCITNLVNLLVSAHYQFTLDTVLLQKFHLTKPKEKDRNLFFVHVVVCFVLDMRTLKLHFKPSFWQLKQTPIVIIPNYLVHKAKKKNLATIVSLFRKKLHVQI